MAKRSKRGFYTTLGHYVYLLVLSQTVCCVEADLCALFGLFCPNPTLPTETYVWPAEDEPHEGTWLQWPHDFGWDPIHIQRHEEMFIEFVQALYEGEKVHIIVYDNNERTRVSNVLQSRGINMAQLDFFTFRTDDVWVRDNGPVFVYDENNNLVVTDWGFNGWGNKADFLNDNAIPGKVAQALSLPSVSVSMINEGGSIEVDGRGTLMAKESSILNPNRNPGLTKGQAEAFFRTYLGVTNFIWLRGTIGQDITDDHIDGTARFANGDTIVTMAPSDFSQPSEYVELVNARDVNGNPYNIVHLPLTANILPVPINDYGIYVNYYVGNQNVLVPSFGDDPNNSVAASILQTVYPLHQIVSIESAEFWIDGGLVHCATMQQPLSTGARRKK